MTNEVFKADFSALEGAEEVVSEVDTEPVVKADDAKKKQTKAMVNNFINKIKENPEIKDVLFTASKSIQIVNTCGYGDKDGLIQVKKGDQTKKGTDEGTGRVVQRTAKIVGYVIENIGNEPIKFDTAVWTKNAEGIYEEQKVQDVINPGEKKAVSRMYITALAARPEFSFTFANGRIVGSSSSANAANKSAAAILSSYHFTFGAGASKSVHDDDVQVAIADKKEVVVDGVKQTKWVVKPEYEAVFGNLNNPKATTRKTKAVDKDAIDFKTAAAADFARTLIENNGIN